MTFDKPNHGTTNCYRQGCRCDGCRQAAVEAARQLRDRKRAARPRFEVIDLPGERWAEIPGHEGYQVSDLGRVKSLPRTQVRRNGIPLRREGKLLKPVMVRGYGHVSLARRTSKIHQLVLAAFVGPMPDGMVTRHLNGQACDNRLCNLTYGTQSENNLDSVRHGTHPQARITECKHRHPLSGDNLRMTSGGKRACRTCTRERQRKYRMAGAQ
jgi:hypothetical protein